MKHLILISFLSCFFFYAKASQPVEGLVKRLLPAHEKQFVFEIVPSEAEEDFFELSSKKKKIHIKANSPVSLASGLNWYLKYYCNCSFSFCGDQIELPAELPAIDKKIRKSTPLTCNFYMNYCTFSYTTAFWDWKRWEREIDLMALNGITMPMAMVGAEAVWRNTLQKFGYTDTEIKEFLCGPAYFGWLLMGNLEKLGGPLPDEWFTQQIALQKKIVTRMRAYGMQPVFQGFFGMVPESLQRKYPQAHFIPQGQWNLLNRPPMLDPSDPLFAKMAQTWYSEYEKLFGAAEMFGGDLFHEGGQTGGINVTEASRQVQQAMLKYDPQSTWIIQAWGGNPTKELLAGLNKENTLVIDICAEFWDNWRQRKGFEGFPWIWAHLTNYGGNIGLHGRLDAIAAGPIEGRTDPEASKYMKGIGATPEGIEVNPVAFDLSNEMRWLSESPNVDEWLQNYSVRRYGSNADNLKEAWKIFHRTAYGTFDGHRRPSESVFCANPNLKGTQITVSAWSQCRIFYDPSLYAQGVELFLQNADQLKDKATYQYDAIDFVRQYITNLGREAYYQMVDAYQKKSSEPFQYWSARFLELLKGQDELLSTHDRFFIGRWLDMARAHSEKAEIQDTYEYNARMLVTTWTEKKSPVRDYAHKEWGGILRDFYLPRWELYVAYLQKTLNGEVVPAPDFYPLEVAWVNAHNKYHLTLNADPVETAKRLFHKFKSQSLSAHPVLGENN